MKTYRITLRDRIETAKDTYIFTFAKPETFTYSAGQYISLCVEPPEIAAPGGTMRELSLSSAPYEDVLTTALRFRESPAKKLYMQVREGEQMYLQGPFGTFHLKKSLHPIVFLAGGIGITPLLSLLKQAVHDGWENQFLILFSNRRVEDMPYLPELHSIIKKHPAVHLVNTLTLHQPTGWQEERGYINSTMLRKYLKDPTQADYYIAGPQRFVGGMWEILDELTVSPKRIHGEEFTGY